MQGREGGVQGGTSGGRTHIGAREGHGGRDVRGRDGTWVGVTASQGGTCGENDGDMEGRT